MTSDGRTSHRVHVVLVNYRSADDVERQLRSAALQGHDVVVVDNGSEPDRIARACAEHGARAILLGSNIGFAGGVNAAVRAAPADAAPWLLLNPDVELTPDLIRRLAGELDTAGIDGVAPLLREPSGRLQVGVGGGPLTAWSVASYFLFASHVFGTTGVFYTRRQSRHRTRAAWLCMACLLLRPDVFARFGPIPEDELVYAEDVAWGTAATASGARFALLPDVEVVHAMGASGGSAAWIGALERLCRRRLGGARAAFAVTAIRLGLGLRRALGRRVT